MNKTNFALMAALYDTEGAGLYEDIYLPIIRYSLLHMHFNQNNDEMYYDPENLQQLISSKFGLNIPLTVLKQAIKLIGKKGVEGLSITVYENGNKFLIKKDWNAELDTSIEDRFGNIENLFDKLELGFREYMLKINVISSKTFLDFVKDNSMEIYKYFENGGDELDVNQEYYHIVKYLSILKYTDKILYSSASNIFWASVIAGFLQRDRNLAAKPSERILYYLDTALILALLDLSSEEYVKYTKELLSIIMSSAGGQACIHGLTLLEVDSILYSVEQERRPRPNSTIEQAYLRRGLTPSKISSIRTNLISNILDLGIIISPQINNEQRNEISSKYKNNLNVKFLKELRNEYPDSFAATHDVYLIEFIKRKRGENKSLAKANCSFLSLNTDLMRFGRDRFSQKAFPYILHPSKIIMDLWMHNSISNGIKKSALSEAISRCLALNNRDVQSKLQIISKYCRREDFTPEEYTSLELALINRSSTVLKYVDELESNGATEKDNKRADIKRLVNIAVQEELARRDSLAVEASKINAVQDLARQSSQDYQETLEQIRNVERALKAKDSELSKVSKISELKDQIFELEKKIINDEKVRNDSICMTKYWVILIFNIIITVIILTLVLIIIIDKEPKEDRDQWLYSLIGLFIGSGFITFILDKFSSLFILSPKINYYRIKQEQIEHWNSRNPDHYKSVQKLTLLKSEMVTLESS